MSPPYLPKPHPLDPVWHLLRVQYGGPDSGRVLFEPDRFAAPSPPPNSPRPHPWDPKPEPRTPAPVAPPSPAPGNRSAVYSTKPLAEVGLDKQNNGKCSECRIMFDMLMSCLVCGQMLCNKCLRQGFHEACLAYPALIHKDIVINLLIEHGTVERGSDEFVGTAYLEYNTSELHLNLHSISRLVVKAVRRPPSRRRHTRNWITPPAGPAGRVE